MFRGYNAHDDDEFEDEEVEEEGEEEEEEEGEEEEGEEEEEEEGEEEEEDPADIERQFRELRARVRGCADLDDLRKMRANLRQAISAERVQGIARVRATDLIELIDDRITDLRAKQIADWRS